MTHSQPLELSSRLICERAEIVIFEGETESEAKAQATKQVKIMQMPTFPSFAKHRAYVKERLVIGFHIFAKLGYEEGVSGHMTARDPEYSDFFWVNPFAVHFGKITTSNLILVNHQGNVVRGEQAVNRSAFAIHSEIHQVRPDVFAACHTHSMHGKTFSVLGRKLLPITQDACAFYDDHAIYSEYGGVALDTEEGKRIAAALGKCKGVILQNHGLITVGKSVDEAVWWFVKMDRCCQSQLLAEMAVKSVDKLTLIDHETAKRTSARVGTEGWINAQPLFGLVGEEISHIPGVF